MSEPVQFFPMHVGIVVTSAVQLAAVYALLGGSSTGAIATADKPARPTPPKPANATTGAADAPSPANAADTSSDAPATTSENTGKTDAAGVEFDPTRHTGTIVKSGLWRLKTGLSRPDEEGENSSNYVNPNGDAAPKAGKTPPPPPGKTTPPPPPAKIDPNRPTDPAFIHDNGDGTELWYVNDAWDDGHPVPGASAPAEDDEFAAFAAAATTASAPVARSWTDGDLSKLCNDAAVKNNGPEKIKPIIAKYIPEGQTAHSRNIPQAQREAFAQEVEAAHGFSFEA